MQAANIIKLQQEVTLIKSEENNFQNNALVSEHGIDSTSVINLSSFSTGV